VLKVEEESNRNKLRICKLLSTVTTSGHTALSWAACTGHMEIIRHLLANGATTGYYDLVLHMATVVVQTVFRFATVVLLAFHRPAKKQIMCAPDGGVVWMQAEEALLGKRRYGSCEVDNFAAQAHHRPPAVSHFQVEAPTADTR
jgi:hypothetical protein